MTIETKKVASVNEAIELINRLNFRNNTFQYKSSTYSDDYKIEYRHLDGFDPNGEGDGFALIEIVVDGKLEVVRFFNLFRNITVDFRLGDFTPDYSESRFDTVIDIDEGDHEDFHSRISEINKAIDENEIAANDTTDGYVWGNLRATIRNLKATRNYYENANNAIEIEEVTKMTIETKISANGSKLYYVNGKRTSRNKALEIAANNRDNLFTIEFATRHAAYFTGEILEEPTVYESTRKAVIKELGLRINESHGFTVQLKTIGHVDIYKAFKKDWAKSVVNKIEKAFINGEFGVKVDKYGKVSILTPEPDIEDYAVSTDAQEIALVQSKIGQGYFINPKDDAEILFNNVDLFLENGNLKISAYFQCKKIETAYRRFRKIMDRAASEVPELVGWDNWTPATKLTQNEYGWENENGDLIFSTSADESIAIDINEDTFYIWGNFSNAYENATSAEQDVEEKYFYRTKQGNVLEVQFAETGFNPSKCWHYFHDIAGLSEEAVIEAVLGDSGAEVATMLCKYLANDTDGSEEDDDETFSANVLPPEEDDTDDELIDPPDIDVAERIVDCTSETLNDDFLAKLAEFKIKINITETEDTDAKNYPVKFNGKTIATLDTLTLAKALPPDKFFEQVRPLVDNNYSPKDQFINDRLNELNDLLEFQKSIGDDKERLKILSDMIEQLKRDIFQAEFDYNEK